MVTSGQPWEEDGSSSHDLLSLRQASELLPLDPLRLVRLGRFLHLAPRDACLPRSVIDRAKAEADEERAYRVILDWLLASLPGKSGHYR